MSDSEIHIAHLSSVHQADDLRIFSKEVQSLASAGFKLTLVAQAKKSNLVNGVRICRLRPVTSRWQRVQRVWDVWQAVRRIRPALVHLHDPELLLLVLPFKYKCRLQIIFDAHESVVKDIRSKYWLPFWLRPLLATLYSWFEQWTLHWVDGLVVVAAEIIGDYGHFPPTKIAVVRNFPIVSMAIVPEVQALPDRLIFVGRPTPIRGIAEMIRALHLLRHTEASLELIGPIDNAYRSQLTEQIQKLELTQRVMITATTDQEQIADALHNAEIGLVLNYPVPNHMDSLPTKAFTYMMNRLPLVASDIPKWVTMISRHQCGITVDPYQPPAIAAAIDRLLDQPEQRWQMGENGYRAVMEYYNWPNEFTQLLALYRKVLKE